MQSHHNATFLIPICIHRASKKPAGYITKPTRPWQPHTKDRMHPCRATHGSILSLHDAVMLAHVTCVVSYLSCGRERLGQLTRDTEELNMSVLRTRALTKHFHRLRREWCKHIRYSLVSFFPLVRWLSSDWWRALQCLPVTLSMCLSPTRWFTGDPNATVGKAGRFTFQWLCWLLQKKSEWINISTVHRWRLFPIQAIRLPGPKVIMDTAHLVCCQGLQSIYNTHSRVLYDINFLISTM